MTQHGYQDPIVLDLQAQQEPVTLENWLALAFVGDPPENWWQETDVPMELMDELEAYLEDPTPSF